MTPPSNLREKILAHALGKVCVQADDESDLLIALGDLYLRQAKVEASFVTKMLAEIGAQRRSHQLPRLDGFIHWLISHEKITNAKTLIADIVNSPQISRTLHESIAQGSGSPLGSLRALSTSSWSESIGLALNEVDQEAASRWPYVAAFSGADPSLIKKLLSIAPRMETPEERDQALIMACKLRDGQLLGLALALKALAPPSDQTFSICAKELETRLPTHSLRASIGIESRPMLESGAAAALILDKYPNKIFANDLLSGACLENLSFPETLSGTEWLPVKTAWAALGARLSRESYVAIAKKAATLRLHLTSTHSHFNSGKTTVAGRSLCSEDLDNVAVAAIKKTLSMGQSHNDSPLSATNPPLAFTLLDLLPTCGPKGRQAISAAMDGWAERGFGREALSWHRGASGHTQTLGSAITSLPRQKASGTSSANFEKEIADWLGALARQGFDFEIKASPKSKSLGERLRGSASLASFWPAIESSLLGAVAPAQTGRKRSPSL